MCQTSALQRLPRHSELSDVDRSHAAMLMLSVPAGRIAFRPGKQWNGPSPIQMARLALGAACLLLS